MQCQKDQDNQYVCKCKSSFFSQTLDEMEFEKGIWYAAQHGDNERVRKLAIQGVDKTDKAGYTALHYAVRAGHIDVCKLLLSLGASPNAQTRSGLATPLHRSATSGRMEIFTMLISAGANIYLKDSDGQTVLHRAAAAGHLNLVKHILTIEKKLLLDCDNRNRLPVDLAKSSVLSHNSEFLKLFDY